MPHTPAVHSKYQPNQLPKPPPTEYNPASNTTKLNLSQHVLRREDFATCTEKSGHGDCFGGRCDEELPAPLSPHFNPEFIVFMQSRTPEFLHFFSRVPKQGQIFCLMAFYCLSEKKKKKKGLANNSSILGISERNITSFLQPDHDKGPISTTAGGAQWGRGAAAGRGAERARGRRRHPSARPSGTAALGSRSIPLGHRPPGSCRPRAARPAAAAGRSGAAPPSPWQRDGRKPLPGHAAEPTGGGGTRSAASPERYSAFCPRN